MSGNIYFFNLGAVQFIKPDLFINSAVAVMERCNVTAAPSLSRSLNEMRLPRASPLFVTLCFLQPKVSPDQNVYLT